MACPKCAAPVPEGAVECPACGIIFEKWRKREERRRREREGLPPEPAAAAPRPEPASLPSLPGEPELRPTPPLNVDPWTARVIAGGVVLAWLVAVAWFMSRHPGGHRPGGNLPAPGQTVYVRDEASGDMKPLKVETPALPAEAPRTRGVPVNKGGEVRESSWVEQGGARGR